MSSDKQTRRGFLRSSLGAASAAAAAPYFWSSERAKAGENNDRPNIASIGVGGMGSGDGRSAARFGNMVACADVDRSHGEKFAANKIFAGRCQVYTDYRKILDRQDIEVVLIGTPDHWHSKIVIDALRAGKDVQCQKPLTLTIDEGKQICRVVKESGKILHIGTQQRSENKSMFLKAIVLAQSGRLGKTLTATCSIGAGPTGGPFAASAPPEGLDWDFWLGQAPVTPYTRERCHGTFRWWLEYSGGKMTDWGAHHIDIAQWGLGYTDSGPREIEGTGELPTIPADFNPVKFFAGELKLPNAYNTATRFHIELTYENGNKMIVQDGPDNGVWFEGDRGRIFVSRSKLTGAPVENLTAADQKWLDEEVIKLYRGKQPGDHMGHFFQCLKERSFTISDPFTHHRTMTACHLCNIALLLKRKLRWDPVKEDFIGDEVASALRSRPQREPYAIKA